MMVEVIPSLVERTTPIVPITERTIIAGRYHNTGSRFCITRRSDGRYGYCVWVIGKRVEAGSEKTEIDAQAAVKAIIKGMQGDE